MKNNNYENMSNVDLVIRFVMMTMDHPMSVVNAIKHGKFVALYVQDNNRGTKKELKRWGGDFVIMIDEGKIVQNTLDSRAWSWEDEEKRKEADNAIVYFVRQFSENNNSVNIYRIDTLFDPVDEELPF